jgi:hypothetical protein
MNSASDINGTYGNAFSPYLAAFTENSSPLGKILGLNIYKPATAGPDLLNLTTVVNGITGSTESALPGSSDNTESFLDILKSIGKTVLPVVSTGIQIASPFLGPLGAPASAIAGVALGALSKATESSFNNNTGTFQSATPSSSAEMNGCAQRAVLAESTLQTALKLDSSSPQAQKILGDMAKTYDTLKPLQNLNLKLFPAIAGPALRIALNNSITPPPTSTESSIQVRKPLPNANSVESSFGTAVNAAFAAALLAPTIQVTGQEYDILIFYYRNSTYKGSGDLDAALNS